MKCCSSSNEISKIKVPHWLPNCKAQMPMVSVQEIFNLLNKCLLTKYQNNLRLIIIIKKQTLTFPITILCIKLLLNFSRPSLFPETTVRFESNQV